MKFTDVYNHLLNDSSLKAVVIATPAAYHYQMAKEALHSKKHVFVEEP
ncbi:MAG: Gfo/Idh/MocA family oxidoreductase [Candidatus Scalindua sediminis]|nr:Gfo/Idh/MocA family oxidoreductase [Candidatus Scalindua sediminis]